MHQETHYEVGASTMAETTRRGNRLREVTQLAQRHTAIKRLAGYSWQFLLLTTRWGLSSSRQGLTKNLQHV